MITPELMYTCCKHNRKPFTKLDEFKLPPNIYKELELAYLTDKQTNKLTSLHANVGPNLLDGSDNIIVAPGEWRRTLSYMLPVLGLQREFSKDSADIGATMLIITGSERSGFNLETKLQSMLHGKVYPPIQVQYFEVIEDKENVPGIIITDIVSIENIRNDPTQGRLLFDRLTFLVFEETDMYNREEWGLVRDILDVALNYHGTCQTSPIRIVITSNKWTSELEKLYATLLKTRDDVCLYIDILTEVLRFGKILWKVDLVNDDTRLRDAVDILKEHKRENTGDIVVSCSTIEVAQEIIKACSVSKMKAEIYSDAKTLDGKTISVVPDDMLGKISFNGWAVLLNYDSTVNQRFRLWYLWQSLPKVNFEKRVLERKELVANYMMTGKESNFLPLYRFMQRLDRVKLDSELGSIGKALHDKKVSMEKLCRTFKLFGSCNVGEFLCLDRHDFNQHEVQATPLAPCSGELEFYILQCINPSIFRVLMLRHYSFEGGSRVLTKSYETERSKREKLMKEHYNEDDKKSFPQSIELGGLYACRFGDQYRRVKIQSKLSGKDKRERLAIVDMVRVQCLDSGITQDVSGFDLIALHEPFLEWPSHVVNIILGNIRPNAKDMSYSSQQISNARHLISRRKEFVGKIWFSIGDTVWVNPMISRDEDKISLRSQFLESKVAISNGLHLTTLGDSLKKLDGVDQVPVRSTEDNIKDFRLEGYHMANDPIQWAHVDASSLDLVCKVGIKVTYAYEPWLFFGVLTKHTQLIKGLEKDLSTWAKGAVCGPGFYEAIPAHSVVAVRTDTSRWVRGFILNKRKIEGSYEFDVFLADFGETLWHLKEPKILPILKKFVNQLPMQCIGFCLNHVVPTDNREEWNDSEKDTFLDLLLPDEYGVNLNVAVLDDCEQVEDVPCRYYVAVAVLDQEELGDTLVSKESAVIVQNISEVVAFLNQDSCSASSVNVDELEFVADDDEEDDDMDKLYENFDVNLDFGGPISSQDAGGLLDELVNKTTERLKEIKEQLQSIALSSEQPTLTPTLEATPVEEQETKGSNDKSFAIVDADPSDMPAFIRSINNGLLHPTVLWHQTQTEIFLKVLLPDVREDTLTLGADSRILNYQTQTPVGYGFYLQLFGKVLREFEKVVTGQVVKMTFKKRNVHAKPWIRLLDDKTYKPKWLKQDPDYMEESESEEDIRTQYIPQGPAVCEQFDHEYASEESDDEVLKVNEDALFKAPEKYQNGVSFDDADLDD